MEFVWTRIPDCSGVHGEEGNLTATGSEEASWFSTFESIVHRVSPTPARPFLEDLRPRADYLNPKMNSASELWILHNPSGIPSNREFAGFAYIEQPNAGSDWMMKQLVILRGIKGKRRTLFIEAMRSILKIHPRTSVLMHPSNIAWGEMDFVLNFLVIKKKYRITSWIGYNNVGSLLFAPV